MYGLCSKALPANFSVLPKPTDTIKVYRNRLIGVGEITRVRSADCGATCLSHYWCQAYVIHFVSFNYGDKLGDCCDCKHANWCAYDTLQYPIGAAKSHADTWNIDNFAPNLTNSYRYTEAAGGVCILKDNSLPQLVLPPPPPPSPSDYRNHSGNCGETSWVEVRVSFVHFIFCQLSSISAWDRVHRAPN